VAWPECSNVVWLTLSICSISPWFVAASSSADSSIDGENRSGVASCSGIPDPSGVMIARPGSPTAVAMPDPRLDPYLG